MDSDVPPEQPYNRRFEILNDWIWCVGLPWSGDGRLLTSAEKARLGWACVRNWTSVALFLLIPPILSSVVVPLILPAGKLYIAAVSSAIELLVLAGLVFLCDSLLTRAADSLQAYPDAYVWRHVGTFDPDHCIRGLQRAVVAGRSSRLMEVIHELQAHEGEIQAIEILECYGCILTLNGKPVPGWVRLPGEAELFIPSQDTKLLWPWEGRYAGTAALIAVYLLLVHYFVLDLPPGWALLALFPAWAAINNIFWAWYRRQ